MACDGLDQSGLVRTDGALKNPKLSWLRLPAVQNAFVGPDGQVFYLNGAWGVRDNASVDGFFAVQKCTNAVVSGRCRRVRADSVGQHNQRKTKGVEERQTGESEGGGQVLCFGVVAENGDAHERWACEHKRQVQRLENAQLDQQRRHFVAELVQPAQEKRIPAIEAERAHVLEHFKEQRHLLGLHVVEAATNAGHDG